MEEVKTIVQTEVLKTETLLEGTTKKIEIKKHWNSHGKKIDWGTEVIKFDKETPFKIVSKTVRYNWKFMPPTESELWNIYAGDEMICKDCDIVGYELLKTKLVLEGCAGAG